MAESLPEETPPRPGSALLVSPAPSVDTPALTPSSLVSAHRSFSSASPVSSEPPSQRSRSPNRSCSLPTASSRRRGYIRPQGAIFAPSAQNRDSVLSLGSIAHLQYYFARTGLLAGKGGQLAKTKENGEYDLPEPSSSLSHPNDIMLASPIEVEGALMWEAAQECGQEIMLPPTVSTYSSRTHQVAPPPDPKKLRKDLVQALENTLQGLESVGSTSEPSSPQPDSQQECLSFDEIQGLHTIDITTLAIKAARLYYTLHPNPTVIHQIKPDFQVRKDLVSVMDVLKRWAARKFAGGLREDERRAILVWVSEVGMMIDQEARAEEAERQQREGWQWVDESLWSGREKDREICFLESLLSPGPNQPANDGLAPWQEVAVDASEPSAFLESLADGRRLVRMHNVAVKRSKRDFGEIKDCHHDVAKPYRRAENLRFWLKAAEIRWEKKLSFDIMAVANSKREPGVWRPFEDVILTWARQVRQEITRDWKSDEDRKLHARAKSLALASPANSPSKSKHTKKADTIER